MVLLLLSALELFAWVLRRRYVKIRDAQVVSRPATTVLQTTVWERLADLPFPVGEDGVACLLSGPNLWVLVGDEAFAAVSKKCRMRNVTVPTAVLRNMLRAFAVERWRAIGPLATGKCGHR